MGQVMLRQKMPASNLPESPVWPGLSGAPLASPQSDTRELGPSLAPDSLKRAVELAAAAIQAPTAFGCLLEGPHGFALATCGLPHAGRIALEDWKTLAKQSNAEVTTDAWQHPLLAAHPLTRAPVGPRFYASTPVRDSTGRHLGILAVLAPEPALAEAAAGASGHLQSLADMLGAQLENAMLRDEACHQALALRAARADAERMLERHQGQLQDLGNTIRLMDHRIRTGLQMVNDMLCLQALSVEEEGLAARLTSAAGRIQALAEVHTLLQHAPAARRIGARAYLQKMLHAFRSRWQDSGRAIVLREGPEIPLSALDAPRLGIVAWELLGNAMRHGRGDVGLELRLEGVATRLHVLAEDQGAGLTPGILRDLQSASRCDSGLHLIRLVAGGEAVTVRQGAPTRIGITLDLRQEG